MQGIGGGQGISRWFKNSRCWCRSIKHRYIWSYNSTSYRSWRASISHRYVVALLIIGIEITAMGVVGKLIVGKIPNRKKP